MRKLLLNLTFGEPIDLVKKLSYFDNPIELYVMMEISLHLGVHDLVHYIFINVVRVQLCRVQVLFHL